jgi:hypothetical protein
MKRHVAATVLLTIVALTVDSHVNWVRHDQGHLLEISGQSFDAMGWGADQWHRWRTACDNTGPAPLQSPVAQEVLQAIAQHSMPDSLEARLLQLRQEGDWAVAEAEFKTLNPSIVVLRRHRGIWHIQDSAVWSGSTAPWQAGPFVRRYLRQQAADMPERLLNCFYVDAERYGQGPRTESMPWPESSAP